MRTEADIRMKLRALKDMEASEKHDDVASRAILAGEIEALEWMLVSDEPSEEKEQE